MSSATLTPRELPRVSRDQIIVWCSDGTYHHSVDKAAGVLGGRESVDALDILWAGLCGDLPALGAHRAAARPEVLPGALCRWLACDYADTLLDRERADWRDPSPRSVEAARVARRHALGLATDAEMGAAWHEAWLAAVSTWSKASRVAAESAQPDPWCAAWQAALTWRSWVAAHTIHAIETIERWQRGENVISIQDPSHD